MAVFSRGQEHRWHEWACTTAYPELREPVCSRFTLISIHVRAFASHEPPLPTELTMIFISSAGRLMRGAASLAVGSSLALATVSAQQSSAQWTTVAPGQRVRITTSGALAPVRQAGRVLSVQADSILLEPDGGAQPVAFPRFAITDMEVSRGQHRSTAAGIVIGVLGGGAAGVIAVAATPSKPGQDELDVISTGQAEAILGMFGAIVGGIVGGLVGHAHRSENWAQVPPLQKFSVTPMITPGRAPAAGVRFAFAWR
jgi:hypothetical protein